MNFNNKFSFGWLVGLLCGLLVNQQIDSRHLMTSETETSKYLKGHLNVF